MDKSEFKNRRERMGLSQAQLSEKLGMSVSTISKYEIGVNDVPKYFEYIFESLEHRHIENMQKPV